MKKKCMSIGFLAFCLGILLTPITFVPQVTAQGGTIILNPTDDTYENMNSPNSNYGSETTLKVCLTHYWAWLKFDLSSIPEGALGITAVLELYTTFNGVTDPHTVVACLILNNFNNSWSEDTLTGANAPPYGEDVELDTDYVANDERWYEWSVTEAVVNATANNATGVTLIMRYPFGMDTLHVEFNSKEAGKKIPRLTIQWDDVAPPPDTTAPTISILSPQAYKTYAVNDVSLTFTVSESTFWIGYSVDGAVNVTITGNATLNNLVDGTHYVVVYANDTAGNMGSSDTVYFTIDTIPPNVEILSPENMTYTTNSVPLSFTINEATSWIGYSLDDQTNVTIAGSTTLTDLSYGTHSLIVYVSDMAGNMGFSITVHFSVQTSPTDTTPPNILIVSPENKIYATSDIPLTFTIDESVSWMSYSLDNMTNVTIVGNTTLSRLSDGSHSLIVYAEDTLGNIGASETVYFNIETQQPEPQPEPEPEPEPAEPPQLWIIGVVAVVVIGTVIAAIFLWKRRK